MAMCLLDMGGCAFVSVGLDVEEDGSEKNKEMEEGKKGGRLGREEKESSAKVQARRECGRRGRASPEGHCSCKAERYMGFPKGRGALILMVANVTCGQCIIG